MTQITVLWKILKIYFRKNSDFKEQSGVDSVIVLWTANTERFCDVKAGLNHTRSELEKSLKDNKAEISPSTIFAMASISEKVFSATTASISE